jgi:hypothetical protein
VPDVWGDPVSSALLASGNWDEDRFGIAVVSTSAETGEARLVEAWDRLSSEIDEENVAGGGAHVGSADYAPLLPERLAGIDDAALRVACCDPPLDHDQTWVVKGVAAGRTADPTEAEE